MVIIIKYVFNKNIFRIATILIVIALGLGVWIDGFGILKTTAVYTCPNSTIGDCDLRYPNGSLLTLHPGETFTQGVTKNVANIINWFALIIALICYGINHLLYNRNYSLKDFKENNNSEDKISKKFKDYIKYQFINPFKKLINIFKKRKE